MKRIFALILVLALGLSLCACSEAEDHGSYRIIEVMGGKKYGSACRVGDTKTAAALEAAMQVLAANGTLSALSVSWLGRDAVCLEGDAEALAKLDSEISPRSLMVGVEADLAPLSYMEGETPAGMNVELAMAVGALLGWEIIIIPVADGEIGTHLSAGNIDWALGFGLETLSAAKYALGSCYMESEIVVAVPGASPVQQLKDLEGLRVGTVNDPSAALAISESGKLEKYCRVTTYLSSRRCMNALEHEWCAAVAMDRLCLDAYFG